MSTSDGVYFWYYGVGREPEVYYGGENSREEALKQAWGEYPEGGFTIIEADKSVPTFDVLPADYVLERYEECNEECWGEDGADISPTGEQERELEKALADALQAWMDKHKLRGRVWNFGHMRNEEYIPERQRSPAESSEAK